MNPRLRLFVAADVPERQRRALAELIAPWRDRLPGARWTEVAGQHLTLKFLGWVDDDLLAPVVAATASAARVCAPGVVRVASFGSFPSRKRTRVLWAGIEDPDAILSRLATALADAFAPLGFELEKRAYHAHLTLARFRTPRPFPDDLPSDGLDDFEPFSINRVVLYRSHLSPKGARYEPLRSLPVGPGDVETG